MAGAFISREKTIIMEHIFITELRELLSKHNAYIQFMIDGDTHCLTEWTEFFVGGVKVLEIPESYVDPGTI